MTDRKLSISLLIVCLGLTACGEGMTGRGLAGHIGFGSGDEGGSNQGKVPDVDLAQIDADMKAAEDAMAEAQTALDNAIPAGLGSPGSVSTQSLTGIAEKLDGILDKVFEKIQSVVTKARDVVRLARLKLTDALSKLDPANPQHATLIAKIQAIMEKLDAAEARLNGAFQLVASKIDFVTDKIDMLLAKLDPSNPLLMLPRYELEEIKRVIGEFQAKLASL
jgi:hypothetical protein